MHSIADLRQGMGRGGQRNRGKGSKARQAEKWHAKRDNHGTWSGNGGWNNSSSSSWDWHNSDKGKGNDKGKGGKSKSKGKDKGKDKGKATGNDTKALDVILS